MKFAELDVEQSNLLIKGKYTYLTDKIDNALLMIQKESEQLQTFANIIAGDKDKSY